MDAVMFCRRFQVKRNKAAEAPQQLQPRLPRLRIAPPPHQLGWTVWVRELHGNTGDASPKGGGITITKRTRVETGLWNVPRQRGLSHVWQTPRQGGWWCVCVWGGPRAFLRGRTAAAPEGPPVHVGCSLNRNTSAFTVWM